MNAAHGAKARHSARREDAKHQAEQPVKTCRHCGETWPDECFPPNRKSKDGLSSWCRACHADAKRRTAARYPEKYGRKCYQCERRFTATDGEQICPECVKRFAGQVKQPA